MIIRCSACATRYRIDPTVLGEAGRRLRCTRCGHVWLEPPAPEAPEGSDRPAPHRRRPNPTGWFAAGLVVATAVAGLTLGRDAIVATWPDAVRHYDTVGLTIGVPHTHGLRVVGVVSERVWDGDKTILLVRGVVENTIRHSRRVPALQAVLADEAGRKLYRWRAAPVSSVLDGGQSTTFESWLANPPEAAASLSVDFVAGGRE